MARRAVVRGRVQGVGYRFFALRAARELGEGEDAAMEQYLARLRSGPLVSRVDEVAAEPVEPQNFTSFEIT